MEWEFGELIPREEGAGVGELEGGSLGWEREGSGWVGWEEGLGEFGKVWWGVGVGGESSIVVGEQEEVGEGRDEDALERGWFDFLF